MKIIVGLGNPGQKYQSTRHNFGFMVVDDYAKKHLGPEIVWELDSKLQAEILKIGDLLLVKPQTFMNNSGEAVAALVNFYKVDLEDVIIVHDDLDLLLGKMRIRVGGSAAGNHGVESVIEKLGSDKFTRLRLGIGNDLTFSSEHERVPLKADHFVTEEFNSSERPQVKQVTKRAVEAIQAIVVEGVEQAQNKFNSL